MRQIFILFLTVASSCSSDDTDHRLLHKNSYSQSNRLQNVLFLVQSEQSGYHQSRNNEFLDNIKTQTEQDLNVHIIHERFDFIGSWTILPLFPHIANDFKNISWVMICLVETRVNLTRLDKFISLNDPSKEMYFGRGLKDKHPVIIHHYMMPEDYPDFMYPDLAAGLLFSQALVKRLSKQYKKMMKAGGIDNFNIDSQHELALFVSNKVKRNGILLTNHPSFCIDANEETCITTFPTTRIPNCGSPVVDADTYTAVKTCEKFHQTRLPIILNTWAKETKHITLYSDVENTTIPTVSRGIPNTPSGHCAKTLGILKDYLKQSSAGWFILTDDDTIISLKKVRQLLSCYNSNEAVGIGERYGYNSAAGHGYDYMTMGGGVVLSRSAVKSLVRECSCPQADSPDDMVVGMCMQTLNIPIVHSHHFHQARPEDYSEDLLAHQDPISFHRFWETDPYNTYAMLSKQYDNSRSNRKDEL